MLLRSNCNDLGYCFGDRFVRNCSAGSQNTVAQGLLKNDLTLAANTVLNDVLFADIKLVVFNVFQRVGYGYGIFNGLGFDSVNRNGHAVANFRIGVGNGDVVIV